MFFCNKCGALTSPNENANRVVTETRKKQYNNDGLITEGYETVKEELWCSRCNNIRKKELLEQSRREQEANNALLG
jgi:hypothetical protein